MKQQKIFALFGSLFLLVSSLFSGLFLFLNQGIPMRATDAGTVCPPKTIVLDAGHGGEDSGALGVDGVKEKDLNLQITLILSDLFRAGGYRVILTREDDRLLCDPDTPAGRRKQGDLQNRVRKSAENGSAVLVSIHQNTYPLASCSGLQVWYSGNHPASENMALAVQEGVQKNLQPDNHRKIKKATSAIYLLRHAETPAILIECGFLTSPAECALLQDSDYQKKLALAIFCALCGNFPPDSCAGEN